MGRSVPHGVGSEVLSPHDAVKSFEQAWGTLWRGHGDPRTELMVASSDRAYAAAAHGETLMTAFSERLVWVLSWRDVRAYRLTRPAIDTNDDPSPQFESLGFAATAVVDATSGEVLAVLERFGEMDAV